MLIKTLLNDCYPVKRFVYGKTSLTGNVISIEIAPRQGSRGLCSDCSCESPGYDHLKERRFKFIPLWGYDIEFVYRPRRVQCPKHGVIVERLPWADSKSPICEPFKIFWPIGPRCCPGTQQPGNSEYRGAMFLNQLSMLLSTDSNIGFLLISTRSVSMKFNTLSDINI